MMYYLEAKFVTTVGSISSGFTFLVSDILFSRYFILQATTKPVRLYECKQYIHT